MDFQPKILNLYMVLDLIDVYQYINVIHPKKIQQKIPPTNLFLKYICKFSCFVTNIISSHIYSMHSFFSGFFIYII
jgi:hypothetical protein